ncbi:hypothetical protein C8Q80DRAFT_1104148 [Daedaleopsis nitida]|nr:hypothetical protein C8Q80DRAFT_1104148 [Daedaleopsis nitida]
MEISLAPPIDGDAMLEIFVHLSTRVRAGMPMNSDSLYNDGPRLAALGSKILEAAYMCILFHQRPMKKAAELEAAFNELPRWIDWWVDGYKWREKVRCAQDVNMRDPKETRHLMDAYVGAVFVGGGFKAVLRWIAALVDSSTKTPAQQGRV